MLSQYSEIYPDHGEKFSSAYVLELFLFSWDWMEDGCGDIWCAKVWEYKVIGALSAGLEVSSLHLKESTGTAE